MLDQISQEVIKRAPVGLIVVDGNTSLVSANDFMLSLFSLENTSYEGKQFGNVFGCAAVFGTGRRCGETEVCLTCSLRNGITAVLEHNATLNNVTAGQTFIVDGAPVIKWFRLSASALNAVRGKYAVLSFIDITREKWSEARLKHELTLDRATGTLNKHNLSNVLDNLSQYAHYAVVSVGLVDFDNFKYVNDKWGHLTGDAVLRLFSETARICIRRRDVVGRFGGEEFMFVFPGVDIRSAAQIIRRILDCLRARLASQSLPDITFSAGFLSLDGPGLRKAQGEIVSDVDRLLYQAKVTGKCRFVSPDYSTPLCD